jgi:hypothetical protein
VTSDKATYVLGEIVRLHFEVMNDSDKLVRLAYRPDVSTGYLKVLIATPGNEFGLYNNTSWGRTEYKGPILQPWQSFSSDASVLWNSKPSIPRPEDGKILTDYAFPTTGIYLVKAVLTIPDKDSSTKLKKIESQPVQINITEPTGEDLAVWNQIKDSAEIAAFIQRGSFLTSKDQEEEELVKLVEQITEVYPRSFLAQQIKEKLQTFRTSKEKRIEVLEKSRAKPLN